MITVVLTEDLTCDFRDREICRWDQVGGNWLQFNVALRDNFDWIINSGRTGGTQTGPDRDHTTGSGNYMYLPTSTGIPLVGHAAWFSTHLVLNRNPACMEFYYHMYGREMGTLSLHQLYNAGLNSMKTLWELSGIYFLSITQIAVNCHCYYGCYIISYLDHI